MVEEDNETWILETGHDIVGKKAVQGSSSLSPIECLTYCLWVADYGMRNAGDLTTAGDLNPSFLEDGKAAAEAVGLPQSIAAFSLPSGELERSYFDRFEELVDEIRAAYAAQSRG